MSRPGSNTDPGGRAGARHPLAFILTTVAINMLGVGLAWPVLPKLIQSMGSGSVSEAASAYALVASLFAISQFIFAPLLGALSDRFGRRPVLLVCLTGLGIDYFLTALAPGIVALAAVRFVGGAFAATMTTANAAMADISTPENRARNFGYVGAAFGIGFIAGPLIGGWLGSIDVHLPFFAAAALSALNVLFGYFSLPETLPPGRRSPVTLADANPVTALLRMGSFPALLPLMVVLLVTAISQRGLEGTWVLYTEFRFGWDLRAAAWSLAFVGIMYFIVQGFLVGPVTRRFGERTVLVGGLAIACVTMFSYGAANSGWLAYPLIATYAFGNGVAGPALNAICSKAVPPDRQGRLQGVLQAINSLAIIIGPLLASLILANVSGPDPLLRLPGAWFLLSGLAFLLATAIAALRTSRQD